MDSKSDSSVIPASEALDHITNILNNISDAPIPFGGLLNNYITRRKIDRLQKTVETMKKRLAQLNVDVLQSRIVSDEFLHLSVLTLERLHSEHRLFKLRIFGMFLADAVVNAREITFDRYRHILETIHNFDFHHIALLKKLFCQGVLDRNDKQWVDWNDLLTQAQQIAGVDEDLVVASLSDLGSKGLLKTKGAGKALVGTNPIGLWKISKYSITPLGYELFIVIQGESIELNETVDSDSSM